MLVPLTAIVAIEGTPEERRTAGSQPGCATSSASRTSSSPPATCEAAVNFRARERSGRTHLAAIGPILGTGMLALLPMACQRGAAARHLGHGMAERDGCAAVLPILPERRHGEGRARALDSYEVSTPTKAELPVRGCRYRRPRVVCQPPGAALLESAARPWLLATIGRVRADVEVASKP